MGGALEGHRINLLRLTRSMPANQTSGVSVIGAVPLTREIMVQFAAFPHRQRFRVAAVAPRPLIGDRLKSSQSFFRRMSACEHWVLTGGQCDWGRSD